MLAIYRGHVIVVLYDEVPSAEISEKKTGIPLPTKIFALQDEDFEAFLGRAKSVVDAYLTGASAGYKT